MYPAWTLPAAGGTVGERSSLQGRRAHAEGAMKRRCGLPTSVDWWPWARSRRQKPQLEIACGQDGKHLGD